MPPSVPPRLEPSELKKPEGREALARALSNSANHSASLGSAGVKMSRSVSICKGTGESVIGRREASHPGLDHTRM